MFSSLIISHYQSPWHEPFWLPWNIDYGQSGPEVWCGLDSKHLLRSVRTSMVHTCGRSKKLCLIIKKVRWLWYFSLYQIYYVMIYYELSWYNNTTTYYSILILSTNDYYYVLILLLWSWKVIWSPRPCDAVGRISSIIQESSNEHQSTWISVLTVCVCMCVCVNS